MRLTRIGLMDSPERQSYSELDVDPAEIEGLEGTFHQHYVSTTVKLVDGAEYLVVESVATIRKLMETPE